ncbi:hypothetical protein [Photorhabdus sp. RM323S]|uniref:hypothetical protein n=1 Tax=Photorhabdus sp. RM323S TaxID=3342828 RepID=UPI0036DC3394
MTERFHGTACRGPSASLTAAAFQYSTCVASTEEEEKIPTDRHITPAHVGHWQQ